MTPEDVAKADQASKALADLLPSLWRGIYKGCVNQGFSESESLELLKIYITATARTS